MEGEGGCKSMGASSARQQVQLGVGAAAKRQQRQRHDGTKQHRHKHKASVHLPPSTTWKQLETTSKHMQPHSLGGFHEGFFSVLQAAPTNKATRVCVRGASAVQVRARVQ